MKKKLLITIDHLSVQYNQQLILNDVSCFIPQGVMAAIIGPNGAGKSTLIKAMLDFIPKKNGTVTFFEKNTASFKKQIAYIPQRAEIDWDFPMTVYDVVSMGRYPHHSLFSRFSEHDYRKIEESLATVSMLEYKNEGIGNLSGGQQQRCFLARAIAQEAEIYILDEPFVGIDVLAEKMMVDFLKKLKNDGKTIIIVHHDFSTVHEYFDWIILLNNTVIGFGPTTQFFSEDHLTNTYKKSMQDIL